MQGEGDSSVPRQILTSQYTGRSRTDERLAYSRTACWHVSYEVIVEDEIDGLLQDWSNSIANATELLQPCTKSSNSLVQDCNDSSALAMELL